MIGWSGSLGRRRTVAGGPPFSLGSPLPLSLLSVSCNKGDRVDVGGCWMVEGEMMMVGGGLGSGRWWW